MTTVVLAWWCCVILWDAKRRVASRYTMTGFDEGEKLPAGKKELVSAVSVDFTLPYGEIYLTIPYLLLLLLRLLLAKEEEEERRKKKAFSIMVLCAASAAADGGGRNILRGTTRREAKIFSSCTIFAHTVG